MPMAVRNSPSATENESAPAPRFRPGRQCAPSGPPASTKRRAAARIARRVSLSPHRPSPYRSPSSGIGGSRSPSEGSAAPPQDCARCRGKNPTVIQKVDHSPSDVLVARFFCHWIPNQCMDTPVSSNGTPGMMPPSNRAGHPFHGRARWPHNHSYGQAHRQRRPCNAKPPRRLPISSTAQPVSFSHPLRLMTATSRRAIMGEPQPAAGYTEPVRDSDEEVV